MLRPNSEYNPREASRLRSSVDLGFNPEAYKHVFLTEAEKHTVTQMHAINHGHTQALGTETTTKAVVSNSEARSVYSRTNKKVSGGTNAKSNKTRCNHTKYQCDFRIDRQMHPASFLGTMEERSKVTLHGN